MKLTQIKLAPEGGFKGIGPLGLEGGSAADAPDLFNKILSSMIGLMTIIAFIWFVFLLLTGAYGVMTAGGDKAAVEGARKKITMGVIGVVIVIAAVFLVSLIGEILGIPDILNPGGLIDKISL